MITFVIYLIGMVDTVLILSIIAMITALILSIALTVGILNPYIEEYERAQRKAVRKTTLRVFIISLCLCVLVPKSKTLAAMLVAHQSVNNAETQPLPPKALQRIPL